MDVEQVKAFLAVAEELHFGRAAQRLHIAQPPLSRTIKKLERDLGTTLFDRNTRSVKLTASGHALITPAREVLNAVRRAEDSVRLADGREFGIVRIAFAGVSTHPLVAELARSVRSQRPGIQLELSSQNFAVSALKRLVRGDTDIALGRWDVIPEGLCARVVMQDSLVVAVPRTHALAGADELTLKELAGEGFVSLPPDEGSVLADRLRRLAQANGFIADIAQVAPDTQTALALVSAGVGCHLTLSSVAHNVRDPHVAFVRVAHASEAFDVGLRAAWRRSDDSPALHAVLDELPACEPAH